MSNRYHIKTSESNVSKFKEMVIEFTKIDFFYPKNFFNFDLDKLVFESWESPKFIISSNSKYLIKGLTQTKNMKIIFKLSKYSIDVHLYDKFGETLDVNDMWCPPLDEWLISKYFSILHLKLSMSWISKECEFCMNLMRKNKFKESTKGLGYVETILDYIDQMLYSQIHKNNKKILLQYKNKIKLFLKRFSHTKDIDWSLEL